MRARLTFHGIALYCEMHYMETYEIPLYIQLPYTCPERWVWGRVTGGIAYMLRPDTHTPAKGARALSLTGMIWRIRTWSILFPVQDTSDVTCNEKILPRNILILRKILPGQNYYMSQIYYLGIKYYLSPKLLPEPKYYLNPKLLPDTGKILPGTGIVTSQNVDFWKKYYLGQNYYFLKNRCQR